MQPQGAQGQGNRAAHVHVHVEFETQGIRPIARNLRRPGESADSAASLSVRSRLSAMSLSNASLGKGQGVRQGVSQWFCYILSLRDCCLSDFSRLCQYAKSVRCPRVPMHGRAAIHRNVTVVSARSSSASRSLTGLSCAVLAGLSRSSPCASESRGLAPPPALRRPMPPVLRGSYSVLL